jgi:hypothetical protein
VVEGAGATGLAAVLSKKIDIKGRNVAVIITGGNIDLDKFIAACIESLNENKQRMAFKLFYEPKTFNLVSSILQSVSGRIYLLNGTTSLTPQSKLSKG